MDWYALFVETGSEDIVQQYLTFHFNKVVLSSLVPKRKLLERKSKATSYITKKLLPGYVLIHTNMEDDKYKTIVEIPRVIKILNYDSYYSKISESEMSTILKLTNLAETIGFSKIYIEGSSIVVKDGPLKGMEGIIRKINKRKSRATVNINFMGNLKTIDLGIEVLCSKSE